MGSGSLPCAMSFSQFLQPYDSVHRWLAAALPLVVAPFFAELEAAPVSPVITATDKTPRK
jgi:hypothetical protein